MYFSFKDAFVIGTVFMLFKVHAVFAEENRKFNETLVEKICHSFGEEKCPFDNYCFNNQTGDHQPCEYCPNGGKEKECDFSTSSSHDTCNIPGIYIGYKMNFACTWRKICPSTINNMNETIEYDQKCNASNCYEKTYGNRPQFCPNDNKCVQHKAHCDNCTSLNGGDELICTESYCSKLSLTKLDRDEFGEDHRYVKCPKSPKCILKGQWCNGIGDCLELEDEMNCSKKECEEMGKIKCPLEDKCIEKDYACRDPVQYGGYTRYPRNKCKLNMNCVEACLEKEGTNFLCPSLIPSHSKAIWMSNNCPLLNERCYNPSFELLDVYNPNQKLWRCSSEREQYIPIDKVCDNKFDCDLNEDESENICSDFPISMAISYSGAIICGIVTLMICIKSFNFVTHKLMCVKCINKHTLSLTNQEWNKKKRLFAMLLGNEGNKFMAQEKIGNEMSHSLKEQQNIYRDAHDDKENGALRFGMKLIFRYINEHFDEKVTFKNVIDVMNVRQRIYEKIYELELKCHNDDEVSALTCLYKNKGGKVIDFKELPTVFTHASELLTIMLRTIFKSSILLPTIKMMVFVFDFTKDVAFGVYLYRTLFNEKSQDRTSVDDFYLFGTYTASLFLGQILLSAYCFVHRYSSVSVCPHQESIGLKLFVSTIMIIFFPVTGVIMSSNSYMDERIVKDDFSRVSEDLHQTVEVDNCQKKIDWSIGLLTKTEFEHFMTQFNFSEKTERDWWL